MDLNKKTIHEELTAGRAVRQVYFEAGFLACIKSVEDKGNSCLVSLLESELKKIKQIKI